MPYCAITWDCTIVRHCALVQLRPFDNLYLPNFEVGCVGVGGEFKKFPTRCRTMTFPMTYEGTCPELDPHAHRHAFVATLKYLWVICIIFCKLFPAYLHTLCYFINVCRLIKLSSSYQSFVIFSPFLIYSLFYVIYEPYKCTCTTHHTHNSLSCFIVRTLSAPIYLSYSPAVFGHRAFLTMGGTGRGWGFPHRTNRYVSPSINPVGARVQGLPWTSRHQPRTWRSR